MINIFSQQRGSGYPVVLLHGFCETSNVWNGLSKALSDEFRIISPDLPGFGKTPILSDSFHLSDIAGILYEWLESEELSEFIVIGHSLGGYITMEMVRKYRKNLSAFGLFNSSVFEDGPEKKENRNKLIDFISREGVRPFVKTFVPSLFNPERTAEFQPVIDKLRQESEQTDPVAVMAYAAAMRDRQGSFELLKKHAEKALLIAGEKDQNVPLEKSRKMAEILPPGHAHILPDTAHMSMFEQSDRSARIIRDFVRHQVAR